MSNEIHFRIIDGTSDQRSSQVLADVIEKYHISVGGSGASENGGFYGGLIPDTVYPVEVLEYLLQTNGVELDSLTCSVPGDYVIVAVRKIPDGNEWISSFTSQEEAQRYRDAHFAAIDNVVAFYAPGKTFTGLYIMYSKEIWPTQTWPLSKPWYIVAKYIPTP